MLTGAFAVLPQSGAGAAQTRPHVDVIQVTGAIDPVLADFVADAIGDAERGGALALVVQLDSSRAYLDRAEVSRLVDRVRGARVPVAVWVGPTGGGEAEGAAVDIFGAADVRGVAPGTDVAAPAALLEGAIEAPTLGDFIVALDGRTADGRRLEVPSRIIEREDRPPQRRPAVDVRFSRPGLAARTLHGVASPSIGFLLLVAGLLLVVLELYTAGIGLAAATGAGVLVLAAAALGVLPTRLSSVVLVVVGVAGYAIDLQAGAPRAWTVIGTVSLVVGGLRLYDGVTVSPLALGAGVIGAALFMLGGMPAMVRARFSTPTVGRESMLGEVGVVTTALDPDGAVEIRGAPWRARTNRARPIAAGENVRVVAIEGLLLEVEAADPGT